MYEVRVKRVFERPSCDDGKLILVGRLWPRGLSKRRAGFDLWMRDIAPSDELRRWFGHDTPKWDGFCLRYGKELEGGGSWWRACWRWQGRAG